MVMVGLRMQEGWDGVGCKKNNHAVRWQMFKYCIQKAQNMQKCLVDEKVQRGIAGVIRFNMNVTVTQITTLSIISSIS